MRKGGKEERREEKKGVAVLRSVIHPQCNAVVFTTDPEFQC